jgi:hypothetical protein
VRRQRVRIPAIALREARLPRARAQRVEHRGRRHDTDPARQRALAIPLSKAPSAVAEERGERLPEKILDQVGVLVARPARHEARDHRVDEPPIPIEKLLAGTRVAVDASPHEQRLIGVAQGREGRGTETTHR